MLCDAGEMTRRWRAEVKTDPNIHQTLSSLLFFYASFTTTIPIPGVGGILECSSEKYPLMASSSDKVKDGSRGFDFSQVTLACPLFPLVEGKWSG